MKSLDKQKILSKISDGGWGTIVSLAQPLSIKKRKRAQNVKNAVQFSTNRVQFIVSVSNAKSQNDGGKSGAKDFGNDKSVATNKLLHRMGREEGSYQEKNLKIK